MTDDLKKLLEERLPDYHERLRSREQLTSLHDDLATIKDTFSEAVRDRTYSSSHDQGPLEVSVDPGALEEYIDTLGEDLGDINTTLQAIENVADDIAMYTAVAAGRLLQTNNILSAMRKDMAQLVDLESTNLGLNLVGVAFQAYSTSLQESTIERLDEMYELDEEILTGISDLVEGQREIIDNLGEISDVLEYLSEGQVRIAEGIEDLYEGQVKIAKAMKQGFVRLAKGLEEIYLAQVYDTMKGVEGYQALVNTLEANAKTEYSRRAQEKFGFAHEQFTAGNYGQALREVRQSLREQSTHIPSLLLFAQLSVHYGQWAEAKDTYNVTQNIALVRKDAEAYEAAVVGLARVETLNGNLHQARTILSGINKKWGERFFGDAEELYAKLEYRHLLRQDPKKARAFLYNRLQRFAEEECDRTFAEDVVEGRFFPEGCGNVEEDRQFLERPHPEWEKIVRSSPYVETIFHPAFEGPFGDIFTKGLSIEFRRLDRYMFQVTWTDEKKRPVYSEDYHPFTEFDRFCLYSHPLRQLLHEMAKPEMCNTRWDNAELVATLFEIQTKYREIDEKLAKIPLHTSPFDYNNPQLDYCNMLNREIAATVSLMQEALHLANPRKYYTDDPQDFLAQCGHVPKEQPPSRGRRLYCITLGETVQ